MPDREAQTKWVRNALDRFEAPLVSYARRLTGDGDLARDVVQDVFMKLCEEDCVSLNGRLEPWLFTVCRNRALDLLRRKRRSNESPSNAAEDVAVPHPDTGKETENAELTDAVAQMIETLPRNQQEVIHLRFRAEMNYKQIAEVTGLSVSNVGFLLHTAIRTIRERLKISEPPTSVGADSRTP